MEARYIVPSFVERTSQGSREMDPYGKLFSERVIFLGSQVDDTATNDIMAQLLCLEAMDPDRDISLYINSPGGSFTAFTAIYDTMQFVKPDIQTVCLGQANSTAALLLAAGTPGKRMALPSARMLVHQPYHQGSQGQVSDLELHAAEVERLSQLLGTVLAKHTRRTPEQIIEDVERDRIFTAADAKEYGLIDHVIEPRVIPGRD
ncbi:ATP-dependent Clp protease proteolytic subunit [Kitasatospora sp. NPDC097605]|uniref:ATP-dependent Clp protease proteolytic subunit n=1 Tax=Kitasatospora sp. NPDC097605 TaxID=3157226 RepID=UPI00332F435C